MVVIKTKKLRNGERSGKEAHAWYLKAKEFDGYGGPSSSSSMSKSTTDGRSLVLFISSHRQFSPIVVCLVSLVVQCLVYVIIFLGAGRKTERHQPACCALGYYDY